MNDRDRFERSRGQRNEEHDWNSDYYNDDRSFRSRDPSARGRYGYYNEDSNSRPNRGYSRLGGAGEEDFERYNHGARSYGRDYSDERGYYGADRSYGQERGQRYGSQQYDQPYGERDWGRQRSSYGGRNPYDEAMRDFGERSGYGYGDPRGPRDTGGYDSQRGYGGGRNQFPYMGNAYANQRSSYEGSQGGQAGWSGQSSQGNQYGQRSERGRFSGHGPKGYKRNDERIREEVCDALMMNPDLDATDIDVRVSEGEVTLTGTVQERDDKYLAEQLSDAVPGVREVNNSIRTKRANDRESSTSDASQRSARSGTQGGSNVSQGGSSNSSRA